MATKSLHVPQAGYKELASGNYYVAKFGYLSITGAPAYSPSIANLLLFSRGLDRARFRGL